jgi:DNA polymerase elongation subunit (family B)
MPLGTTIRNIAKLLMNSMYGRFGMHTELIKNAFFKREEIEGLSRKYNILQEIPLGSLILTAYALKDPIIMAPNPLRRTYAARGKGNSKFLKSFLESVPGNTNVAIASAVTAYSRMIINEYKLIALNEKLQIYYSDTDSLVLNGPLPPEYLYSATLGKLKLEHTFREGIFVMPKVYYLELEDEGVITKCKGYSGKLSKEQYLYLLEGNSLNL